MTDDIMGVEEVVVVNVVAGVERVCVCEVVQGCKMDISCIHHTQKHTNIHT